MLNPREVTLSVPAHKDGEPWRARVTHRPSAITAEGTGASYDEARAQAQENLEREVAVWQEAQNMLREQANGPIDHPGLQIARIAHNRGPYGYGG